MDEKQKSGIFKAAGLLVFTTVLSRLLGYLRDVVIYNEIGQNYMTDAYNAAFSIPDFIYSILVGGALSSAFIPVFSSYISTGKESEGWKVASIIFNWIIILMLFLVSLGFIFTPQLIKILVPGFDEITTVLTINLTRIMLIQVLFMCLSGFSTGILNSYKQFRAPAIGSVLYNLGIIIGGLLLAGPIERHFPGYGVAAFSIGVVLGSMLNFAVQAPGLFRLGWQYSFSLDFRHPGVKHLVALIVPVFIGLAASQINLFVNQNLASGLEEGMVAALRTAQRLMQLPIGVFAIAIAVAVFPTMTAQVAQNKLEEYKSTMTMGLCSVNFIIIPCAVGIAVLREPIIRFMYEFMNGKFTAENTSATAEALLFYCIGLFAYGCIHVLSRAFYSLNDTKTPVFAAVASVVVNIVLSIVLVDVMQQGGLALAYSVCGIVNMFLLMWFLYRKIGDYGIKGFCLSFVRIIVASALMGLTVYGVSVLWESIFGISSKFAQLGELLVAVAFGAGVYFLITYLWKMQECMQVWRIFSKRLKKKAKAKNEADTQ